MFVNSRHMEAAKLILRLAQGWLMKYDNGESVYAVTRGSPTRSRRDFSSLLLLRHAGSEKTMRSHKPDSHRLGIIVKYIVITMRDMRGCLH